MLVWLTETTLIAAVLAVVAALAGRWHRLGPGARHALWLVVMLKLVTPPVLSWPWAASMAWAPRGIAAPPGGQGRVSNELLGSLPYAASHLKVAFFADNKLGSNCASWSYG
jgi:hypothetical protein